MQDRYAGDENDFLKYAVLRLLELFGATSRTQMSFFPTKVFALRRRRLP